MFNCVKNYFGIGKKKDKLFETDLKDFISEALVSICNGIKDAQAKISKKPIPSEDEKYFEPYIVPSPVSSSTVPIPRDNLYLVDFDLVVIAEKQSRKSGEIGADVSYIKVVAMNLESTKTNLLANRIKFSVPVIYPTVPKPLF